MFYDWIHKLRLRLWQRQERMLARDNRPAGASAHDWIGANVATPGASAGSGAGANAGSHAGMLTGFAASHVGTISCPGSGASCSSGDGGSSSGGE